MQLKSVLHRVLVMPDELEKTTDSGIIIQYDKREEAAVETGVVCDIGRTAFKEFGTTAKDEGIEIGTKVYFAKYAGKVVKVNGIKYLWLNDEDVIGVIHD